MKLEEEADSGIVVADTNSRNQVRRLAIWKTIFRRKNEREQQQQRQQASSEVAVANTGQRSHQPICSAVCVLLVAKETAHSAPDVA